MLSASSSSFPSLIVKFWSHYWLLTLHLKNLFDWTSHGRFRLLWEAAWEWIWKQWGVEQNLMKSFKLFSFVLFDIQVWIPLCIALNKSKSSQRLFFTIPSALRCSISTLMDVFLITLHFSFIISCFKSFSSSSARNDKSFLAFEL